MGQPDYEESIEASHYVRTSYPNFNFEEVLANTRQSLIQAGFDIVIEFAFHDYLRQQLDQDVNRCVILGACNPELVNQLLQGEDKVSPSMLCTITIQDTEDGKSVQVSISDPSEPWEGYDNEQFGQ